MQDRATLGSDPSGMPGYTGAAQMCCSFSMLLWKPQSDKPWGSRGSAPWYNELSIRGSDGAKLKERSPFHG